MIYFLEMAFKRLWINIIIKDLFTFRKVFSNVHNHFNGFIFFKVIMFNLIGWTGVTVLAGSDYTQSTMGIIPAIFAGIGTAIGITLYFFAPNTCKKQVIYNLTLSNFNSICTFIFLIIKNVFLILYLM